MIEDISYQQYGTLEYQYFAELRHLSRPNISIGVYPKAETYIFTVLYIKSNSGDRIEFSHNSMIPRHP